MSESEQRAAVQAFADAAVAADDADTVARLARAAVEQAETEALGGDSVSFPVIVKVADGREVLVEATSDGDGGYGLAYTIARPL